MRQHTRREFLARTTLAAGAGVVAPMLKGMAQAAAPAAAPAAEAPAAGPLAMTIARWQGAQLPETELKAVAEKLTRQAIDGLGGMGRFVKSGHVVWVKPNMAWNRTPEMAANTNPDVVATLVKMCFEAGAKQVKVGDFPCNAANQAYPASGIEAAAKAAGAEVIYLDENRFKEVELNGARLKSWPLYPEIIESDLVINVPVVKHHTLAKATVCMKNYMGIIGGDRGAWHQDIATCLADITAFMKPPLCVVDAVRILTANGPTGGNLADVKRLDTIAAGTDIVALDAFGVSLLGHKPEEIDSVRVGFERGLGQIDYTKLAYKELAVA